MNIVTIEPTKFENVRTGEVSLGVRVYDDHDAVYVNTWESIPDDDLEVFALVQAEGCDRINAMLDYLFAYASGCYIGGVWYEHEQIAHLFGWRIRLRRFG